MTSVRHPVVCALPLVVTLLLPQLGEAAEPRSSHYADISPATVPAPSVLAAVSPEAFAQSPQHDRIISPRLAAALAATLPKYVPAPPTSAKTTGRGMVDRSDETGPDSDILQLPKYVVHGPRRPVFREHDLYTQRGLSELAQRRYITQLDHALNRFRIPLFGISCEARALAMYAEDERLQNMAELDRTARNAALVDRAAGADIKRLADATFQRTE